MVWCPLWFTFLGIQDRDRNPKGTSGEWKIPRKVQGIVHVNLGLWDPLAIYRTIFSI